LDKNSYILQIDQDSCRIWTRIFLVTAQQLCPGHQIFRRRQQKNVSKLSTVRLAASKLWGKHKKNQAAKKKSNPSKLRHDVSVVEQRVE